MIIEDGSKVFFTSDLHFGHKKIIEFCSRPYKNVTEMNKALVDNWNKVVPEDGVVFVLGDFCFGGITLWEHMRKQLNGKIYLILGNHDLHNLKRGKEKIEHLFEDISYQMQIQIEGRAVYLNHYPFLCYGGSYRGDNSVWQLFGHVHSGPNCTGLDSDRLVNLFPYQYDVGVDNNNYTPISWNNVKEIIQKQIQK